LLRHADYTRDRIQQLVKLLGTKVYADRKRVDELLCAGPVGRISYAEAQTLTDFQPAKLGDQYRPMWATFWFRAKAEVPAEWKGSRIDFLWDTQSEATLWIDGRSAQGLNMTQGDRPDAILLDRAKGGESLQFQIEMACNNKFGLRAGDGLTHNADTISPYHLRRCEIGRFDPQAWDLYHDARVLSELLISLSKEEATSDRAWTGLLLSELNRFCNEIDVADKTTWPAAGKILKDLYANHNPTHTFELSGIGHAHIDTAWLWPLAETWRKCERTFSTATAYMRDYPEYRFSCSQAYQYAIIKDRNPDLYERIKRAVKAGQWVIVGGTWIEPDCNIPSGEALCRQFLLGQRYFQKEFGKRCREFWNPDVFGYNGQLPQIMKLAGINRFLTQKLSWNRFNRPEHHTFTWQGIDGSEVLAHFPPQDTYNSEATVNELRLNAKLFKDNDRSDQGMMLFGYGDGGGGPTKQMLETLRRSTDLQGIPRTKIRTSDEFFDLLEKDITDRPLQIGELYFEYHRGTYTSQALVKKNNRKSEFLLHDLEFLAAVSENDYPRDEINKLWEIVLLNQFHDILPGSSITQVYEDSKQQFEEVFKQGEALVDRAVASGKNWINTIGVSRDEIIEQDGALQRVTAQPFAACAFAVPSDTATIEQSGDRFVLTNAHLRATFTNAGKLVSLVHRATNRESLAGEANIFETYDDVPTKYDAWDVDPFHLETRKPSHPAHRAEIVRNDPLRVELRFEQKLGKQSLLKQTVRLDAGAKRLEFHNEIDWQERQTMLKVAFPINARSLNATYEMQFGTVERPTHYNTSFDLAKYEVPFHKWFDFGEHGFGVSLLTDCKYGGSTFGNTMRISLLRAPLNPDPQCDRGRHEFSYAIFPHAGDWRDAGTVAEALRFNVPLRAIGRTIESVAGIDDPNLIIDTIKKAEDSEALVIRLYEAHGARGTAKLRVNRPFKKASLVNILEEPIGEATVTGGTIELPYTPYQILTVLLK